RGFRERPGGRGCDMEMRPLRVAIVDQQRVFVDALSFRLMTEADVEVVVAVEDPETAWMEIEKARPEVLILDAEFPLGRAFDLAAEPRRRLPETRILLLVRGPTDAVLDQALRLHIEGLLSRSDSLTQFVQAVRGVAAGERPVSTEIASRLDL